MWELIDAIAALHVIKDKSLATTSILNKQSSGNKQSAFISLATRFNLLSQNDFQRS
jgi:hypothetical protein